MFNKIDFQNFFIISKKTKHEGVNLNYALNFLNVKGTKQMLVTCDI